MTLSALGRQQREELIDAVVSKLRAMETAEIIMRDQHRRAGHLSDDMYRLHGDRAQAFRDAAKAVESLRGDDARDAMIERRERG